MLKSDDGDADSLRYLRNHAGLYKPAQEYCHTSVYCTGNNSRHERWHNFCSGLYSSSELTQSVTLRESAINSIMAKGSSEPRTPLSLPFLFTFRSSPFPHDSRYPLGKLHCKFQRSVFPPLVFHLPLPRWAERRRSEGPGTEPNLTVIKSAALLLSSSPSSRLHGENDFLASTKRLLM